MTTIEPGAIAPGSYRYLTARGGHYLAKANSLFEACVKVADAPGLPEQSEFFRLTAPKIPLELLVRILAFLAHVYRQHKSEGLVLLTLDGDRWDAFAPRQAVSAARVSYENDGHRRVVGSVHSHPGFGSHPSCVDEADETAFDGVHVIVSAFVPVPGVMSCHAAVSGRRFELAPEDVFEGLALTSAEFPAEWLKNVRAAEPATALWPVGAVEYEFDRDDGFGVQASEEEGPWSGFGES